jgi:transcriptional regulator with XRE-family HTH domain
MDIKALRRKRLNNLLNGCDREKRGAQARLARKVGKPSAQISQWLTGRRTIDEESAREMETFANLQHGWFDTPSPHEGPLDESDQPGQSFSAHEPDPGYVVTALASLLNRTSSSRRQELAQLLGVFTTSGGDPDYAPRLTKLLQPDDTGKA